MYDIMIATEVFDACIMEESQNYRQNTNDYYQGKTMCDEYVKNHGKLTVSIKRKICYKPCSRKDDQTHLLKYQSNF